MKNIKLFEDWNKVNEAETRNFSEYLKKKKEELGSKFDDSGLAKKFIPYFESGERIKVDCKIEGVVTGTVGITTGWKPSFLLMRRSNAKGSSCLLSDADEIKK